jgi:thioredoxin-related protein
MQKPLKIYLRKGIVQIIGKIPTYQDNKQFLSLIQSIRKEKNEYKNNFRHKPDGRKELTGSGNMTY